MDENPLHWNLGLFTSKDISTQLDRKCLVEEHLFLEGFFYKPNLFYACLLLNTSFQGMYWQLAIAFVIQISNHKNCPLHVCTSTMTLEGELKTFRFLIKSLLILECTAGKVFLWRSKKKVHSSLIPRPLAILDVSSDKIPHKKIAELYLHPQYMEYFGKYIGHE